MPKKVGLIVNGHRYSLVDSDADCDFTSYLEVRINEDFKVDSNNHPKEVLQAYIKIVHEKFLQEKEIDEILNKLT